MLRLRRALLLRAAAKDIKLVSGGSPRERRHRRQRAALGTDFKI